MPQLSPFSLFSPIFSLALLLLLCLTNTYFMHTPRFFVPLSLPPTTQTWSL